VEGEMDNIDGDGEPIDVDDPLYGIKERLVNMHLDEQTQAIIIERLKEAHGKVKDGLCER
jgi:hypothetical protein